LPARVPGYQPRWLDEAIASGEWVWVCEGDGENGPGLLAFCHRESLQQLPPPTAGTLDAAAERVLECLQQRRALFVTDLAGMTGLAPRGVRAALATLLRRRLVTNDHFDAIRKPWNPESAGGVVQSPGTALRRGHVRPRGPAVREGRWSLVPW